MQRTVFFEYGAKQVPISEPGSTDDFMILILTAINISHLFENN
jgi:hypothetical protein